MACTPGPKEAPMLLLRPDEQEMTAVHCRELSSPLSDDFVLMGGCSMGRWGGGLRRSCWGFSGQWIMGEEKKEESACLGLRAHEGCPHSRRGGGLTGECRDDGPFQLCGTLGPELGQPPIRERTALGNWDRGFL